METKSRYEVVADLQKQKMDLIREREGFQDRINAMEKTITILKRDIEDRESDLSKFKESVEERKATMNELIKSIDDSLKRFSEMREKK